jgi:molybdate/tungstate transport system substrate-binding protein
MRRRHLAARALALATTSALAVAACSSSTKATVPPTSIPNGSPAAAQTPPRGSGPVDVFYAGSLVRLMTKGIGPAFQSATGYTVSGTSGDSGTLANEIKGETQVGDVFISANPSKDQALEGAANGDWVTWYVNFATSPLVLGYSPQSRFANAIRTGPWYRAITQPGILVGRTDPATDPKGILTATALNTAAATFNLPALASEARNTSNVFPENTLVGRLQAGQLDAGFFYSVEAAGAGIPYVPVSGVGNLQATYTITILAHAPHPAAALAFVEYLLGAAGRQALTQAGVENETPPTVSGTPPPSLRAVLSAG